jgi:hypothetical protein
MRGILADINVIAQCNALLAIWTSATWGELWLALDWSVATFASLGLSDDASDAVIWRKSCVSPMGNDPSTSDMPRINRTGLRGQPRGCDRTGNVDSLHNDV